MSDPDSRAHNLCIEGTQAEFEGRIADAHRLFWQAWDAVVDDFDACVAAHYVGRCQTDPATALIWHSEALARASNVGDDRVREFYPSLYVNLGSAYEALGVQLEAIRYFEMACKLGLSHRPEQPGDHGQTRSLSQLRGGEPAA